MTLILCTDHYLAVCDGGWVKEEAYMSLPEKLVRCDGYAYAMCGNSEFFDAFREWNAGDQKEPFRHFTEVLALKLCRDGRQMVNLDGTWRYKKQDLLYLGGVSSAVPMLLDWAECSGSRAQLVKLAKVIKRHRIYAGENLMLWDKEYDSVDNYSLNWED